MSSSLDFEIKRKIFHLSSLIFPFLYLFTSKIFIVTFLFLLTIVILYFDISRHYNTKIQAIVNKFYGHLIRPEEVNGSFSLSGAGFMFIGLFSSALLFSKPLAINSWLILIISDCLAAIVGMHYNKTTTKKGKSLEGSLIFFVSALLISNMFLLFTNINTNLLIVFISVLVTTILEFNAKKIAVDDNLLIPLSYGITTILLSVFL